MVRYKSSGMKNMKVKNENAEKGNPSWQSGSSILPAPECYATGITDLTRHAVTRFDHFIRATLLQGQTLFLGVRSSLLELSTVLVPIPIPKCSWSSSCMLRRGSHGHGPSSELRPVETSSVRAIIAAPSSQSTCPSSRS